MIIYLKYNSSRKKEFQLITKIEKDNGKIFSSKNASDKKAEVFLLSFFKKYSFFQKNNFSINVVEPVRVNDKQINFEYIKGESLENLLFELFKQKDKEKFIALLTEYFDLLNKNEIKYESLNNDFNKIFGNSNELKFDCLKIGCVDLNFDNIIFDSNKKQFWAIDYEWTFEFSIPFKYIIFRALTAFYGKYFCYNLNKNFIPLVELYNIFKISKKEKDIFINFEFNFQKYVASSWNISLEQCIENYYNLELDYPVSRFIDDKNLVILNNENLNQEIQSKVQEIENKEQIIQSKVQEIENKDQIIISKEQIIDQKAQEIQSKENIIQQKNQEIDSKINELLLIYSSRAWKIIVLMRKILSIFIPVGSFRRKIAGYIYRFCKKIIKSIYKIMIFILKVINLVKKAWLILIRDGFVVFIKKIIKKLHFYFFIVNQNNICSFISKNTHNIKPIKTVYYISNISNGGSRKYINDLIDNFETCDLNFIQIKNKKDLNLYKDLFKNDDILLFQYLYYSDITIKDIMYVKRIYEIKLIIPIHDFYFLQKLPSDLYTCHISVSSNYDNNSIFNFDVFNLLKKADIIIYPSNFVKNIFDSIYVFKNAKLSKHIDYKILDFFNIPKVGDTINIGIINNITVIKGADYYPKLFSINKYKEYDIKYHVFGMDKIESPNVIFYGPYLEDEIFYSLKKNNIHGLIFLNKWGETYSYSLTKGINSGLPILYSNIGAYIERLQNNEKFFPVKNINNIEVDFQNMLHFILKKQNDISNDKIVQLENDIPDLYKNLFSIDYNTILNDKLDKNKTEYSQLFNFIEPYAIYFPQFHALEENKRTFYEGYHDMINLQQAKKEDQSLETPLKNYLGYYNLKNDSGIIEKQILIAKAYGIKGFSIYYYWFSHNSVTGNNMLMKDVVDRFFEKELDGFDIFFIYANESWSGNPAFNQHSNEYIIKNEYTKEKITKNFENLLRYFKHNNYKKVNNKPVLFIHHPWEMTQDEFELFYSVGNEILKNNGFAGIELISNGMHGNYEGYKNYSHHPDYKNDSSYTTIENDLRYIDYKKYVENYFPNIPFSSQNIQTFFYNFDNSVRYFNHKNKNILITKTKNNNIEYFKEFLNLQLETYNSSNKVGKIFLLNSWNEWGEQMALEPSSEYGFTLLDSYNEVILDFVKNNTKSMAIQPFNPISTAESPFMFSEFGENEISVILHLYYTDMWSEIEERLRNIPYSFNLIISLTKGCYDNKDIEKIKRFNQKVRIVILENKGMDILPFLKCLEFVPKTTKYVLKIHTKKSLYESEVGKKWFNSLIDNVLPMDRKYIDMIFQNLEYTDIGMIGGSKVSGFEYSGVFDSTKYYEPKIELIHEYFKTQQTKYEWIAGSMFWVRFDILNKFDDNFISFIEKQQPLGYFKDSTIVHGIERYFGKLVYDSGKVISQNPIQRYSKDYITLIPEKNINPAKKDIYLFFHICCIGNYVEVVNELVTSLIDSGLYEKSIKVFYTILGTPSGKFINKLDSLIKFECIYKSVDINEFEYPTLFYLQDFCKENDVYIMYFHTKGVSNEYDEHKIVWRKRLIEKTIYEHENCISFLNKGCDVSGCGWKEQPYDQSAIINYTILTHSHFSGNFWWAQSSYIKSLPDIRLIESEYKKIEISDNGQSDFNKYRIMGEMWLGMGEKINIGLNGDLNKEYFPLEDRVN